MAERRPIPKAVREQVMKEYKHHCAICGRDHPQLHHIDEDPSNNNPLNLIPLCPNCHMNGEHNPHEALGSGKLSFFRIHKHPFILKPQFHPLFTRLGFLDWSESLEYTQLTDAADELVRLIRMHAMGEFYAEQVGALVRMRRAKVLTARSALDSVRRMAQQEIADRKQYPIQLASNRERVHKLVVEMLAYQQW
jgi:ubiquitin